MAGFSEQVDYPTAQEICSWNRQVILQSGGDYVPPDNFLNSSSLHYILEAISAPIYGFDQYPTLKEKAAAIGAQIISRHVFVDGNKRTGVVAACAFLERNRILVFIEPSIEDLAVAIATREAGYTELLRWLHDHQAGD